MRELQYVFILLGYFAMFYALREAGFWSNTVQLIMNILFIIAFVIWLIREFVKKYIRKQPQLKSAEDERTESVYNRSARNALYATYFVFYIQHLIPGENSIDANWIFYILGSSLVVLMGSYAFYYYRKS